jgi:hypothetical protein
VAQEEGIISHGQMFSIEQFFFKKKTVPRADRRTGTAALRPLLNVPAQKDSRSAGKSL